MYIYFFYGALYISHGFFFSFFFSIFVRNTRYADWSNGYLVLLPFRLCYCNDERFNIESFGETDRREETQMIGEKVAFWEREIPLWMIQKTFYWKRLLWYEATDEIYLLASVWYGHSLQTDEPIIHLKRS